MANFQDAFISYGRADSKAFAKQLNDRLVAASREIWFDFDDIPLGVDYQNQIDAGIEEADNFIYIIAPHSVNSPYCNKEVELALRCHKRIIPILHVEKISQELWQQRNVEGTAEQWEAYQTKGAHSSFPNMHPEIAKINWIYCREGLDDVDKAFEGLLAIMDRQQDYVNRHTALLTQALDWERQQKQSRYLLVGEDRQQAEAWLKLRFKDEQAPCVPSPLHCEFITESIKNGQNLMTQVFLSYAGEELAIMEQVRQSLRREGFTVWTNKTDIQTGVDFQEAIDRGIEESNNIVYLMSPSSLASSYCQQEIAQALKLNKRIVPLLVKPTDLSQIPLTLRSLQYIDLTDNVAAGDYAQDESELLRILRQDAAYYEEHKMLLTKALKWDRQQRNPSILLRGYNLQHAESWLKIGGQRSQHSPLPIHTEFIAASLQQPPGVSLDVFVSYSRADSDLGRKLNDALQAQGKTTWFDQESIASGSDFQREIYRGIENSNNFLFIISPNSVKSPYCADEVEYAQKLNKRIVTILHRAVNPVDLHPVLAAVQWIDFNQRDGEFSVNFKEVLRTIDTDPVHLQTHTRLIVRAIEWEGKDRKDSFLLRGDDLDDAEKWIAASTNRNPKPTALQQDYVKSSRSLEAANQQAGQILEAAAAKGQQRIRIGTGVMTIGLLVAGVAVFFAHQAKEQAKAANLDMSSVDALKQLESNPLGALIGAIQSGKDLKAMVPTGQKYPTTSSLLAIQTTLAQVHEKVKFAEAGNDVSFSPDGQLIVTASDDRTARLWDRSGKPIHQLRGHEGKVLKANFSPDGKQILTVSEDKTARLWDLEGKQTAQLGSQDKSPIDSASFSPDGKQILTTSAIDKTNKVILWDLAGKPIVQWVNPGKSPIQNASFSPNGKQILTTVLNEPARLWDLAGKLVVQLNTKEEAEKQDPNVSFNADGKQVFVPTGNKVTVWDSLSKNKKEFLSAQESISSVQLSRNGKHILTISDDHTVYLFDQAGKLITQLDQNVTSASFSPDGKKIALLSSADKMVHLWDTSSGSPTMILKGHQDTINKVSFSPDSKFVVTTSDDKTARLWDLSDKVEHKIPLWTEKDTTNRALLSSRGQYALAIVSPGRSSTQASIKPSVQLQNLLGTPTTIPFGVTKSGKAQSQTAIEVTLAAFSFDQKFVSTLSTNNTIQIWDVSGQRVADFKLPNDNSPTDMQMSLSPNGQYVVTEQYEDDVAEVRDREGTKIAVLEGKTPYSLNFSPNGKFIVVARNDHTAQVFDMSGKSLVQLEGHKGRVLYAQFSADSQHIVTTSSDGTARVWDISGKPIAELKGHQSDVNHASFSADAKSVVTVSSDGTAKVWDVVREQVTAEFRDESGSMFTDAVFSENGQQIITVSSTGNVQTWPLESLDQLMVRGCRWLSDYLKYGPDDSNRTLCDSVLPVASGTQ